jgi:hypothetical protein
VTVIDVMPDTLAIDQLTIHQALSAVMGDVQSVSKSGRNTSQNYNFRGIDAVVNAVGPALRKHGVVVVPTNVNAETEQYQTKSGTAMKNVALTVTFRFYGPGGDWLEATARGEAADSGDKATSKAHSVAFRTVLLEALCIPTDEPDPDSQSHERKAAATPKTNSKPSPQKTELPGETFEDIFQESHKSGETPTKAAATKLNLLVVELRDAGKITTEQLYHSVGLMRDVDPDDLAKALPEALEHHPDSATEMTLHWGPLSKTLSKGEAHQLIDRLSKLQAAE